MSAVRKTFTPQQRAQLDGIQRAYGVDRFRAITLLERRTDFADAVRRIGPIRAYWSASAGSWTLDQKPVSAADLLAEAARLARR